MIGSERTPLKTTLPKLGLIFTKSTNQARTVKLLEKEPYYLDWNCPKRVVLGLVSTIIIVSIMISENYTIDKTTFWFMYEYKDQRLWKEWCFNSVPSLWISVMLIQFLIIHSNEETDPDPEQ